MTDPTQRARLQVAAIEGRAALAKLQDLLQRTERELVAERDRHAAAERRGAMADGIGDGETAGIARAFVARHAERVNVLEQKATAQRAELALLARDVDEVVQRLKAAGLGVPPGEASPGRDQAGREAEAEARLRELKRRMGR